MIPKHFIWLEHVDEADHHLVGAHAVSLGKLSRNFLPIPQGFVITTDSFNHFITNNKLDAKIQKILSDLDSSNPEDLMQKSSELKKLILNSPFPADFKQKLLLNYSELTSKVDWSKSTVDRLLSAFENHGLAVNVHSVGVGSKTAEGEANLGDAVRSIWAEHYDPIHLKKSPNLPKHIIIQAKTHPEYTVSMSSFDPNSPVKTKLVLTKDSDRYEIDRQNQNIIDPQILNNKKLPREIINNLLGLFKILEKHHFFPIVAEFGVEGIETHILNIKPLTFLTVSDPSLKEQKNESSVNLNITVSALPASPGRKTAPAKLIKNHHEAGKKILPGDILITNETNNHLLPVLRKVSGIITTSGNRHSHASVFAKKRGIPSVVVEENIFANFKDGQVITIDGITGEVKL